MPMSCLAYLYLSMGGLRPIPVITDAHYMRRPARRQLTSLRRPARVGAADRPSRPFIGISSQRIPLPPSPPFPWASQPRICSCPCLMEERGRSVSLVARHSFPSGPEQDYRTVHYRKRGELMSRTVLSSTYLHVGGTCDHRLGLAAMVRRIDDRKISLFWVDCRL